MAASMIDSVDFDQPQATILVLPKARLSVSGQRLLRHTPGNQVICDLPLTSIQDVQIWKEKDRAALTLSAFCITCGGLCKWLITSVLWSWIGLITFGLIGLLAFVGMQRVVIEVTTAEDVVSIDALDELADIEMFVVSLKERIKQCQPSASPPRRKRGV